jgi:hypothetical protein
MVGILQYPNLAARYQIFHCRVGGEHPAGAVAALSEPGVGVIDIISNLMIK